MAAVVTNSIVQLQQSSYDSSLVSSNTITAMEMVPGEGREGREGQSIYINICIYIYIYIYI